LLLALACFLCWLWNPITRRHGYRATFAAILVSLPWILYAQLTFGSVIPSSLIAKLSVPEQSGRINPGELLNKFFPHPKLFLLALAVAGVGWIRGFTKWPSLRPFLLWAPLYFVAMRIGGAPDFAWYYIPPLWFAPLLVLAGISTLSQRLIPAWRLPAALLGTLIALGIWVSSNIQRTRELWTPQPWRNVHKELAFFVRDHASPSDVTASLEVGTLAYWSNRPVLDLLSLTSPETLPWARRRDFLGAIEHYRPRFVAAYIFNDLPAYRAIARWPFLASLEYVVWERIETATRDTELTFSSPAAVSVRKREAPKVAPPVHTQPSLALTRGEAPLSSQCDECHAQQFPSIPLLSAKGLLLLAKEERHASISDRRHPALPLAPHSGSLSARPRHSRGCEMSS
jgi:hypothetical protein